MEITSDKSRYYYKKGIASAMSHKIMEGNIVLLKNSSNLEEFKNRYDEIWDKFQDVDEDIVDDFLNMMDYELLPKKEKLRYKLKPIKTHLLWIIPLSVLTAMISLYAIFVWAALLVE